MFGLLSALSPNFTLLLVFRFLTGMAVGGTLPVDYAMMAEFLPKKVRGRFLVYLESFWALGTILIALLALAGGAESARHGLAVALCDFGSAGAVRLRAAPLGA